MTLFSSLSNWFRPSRAKHAAFANVGELRDAVMAAVRRRPDVDSVTPDPLDRTTFTTVRGDWTGTTNVTNLFAYISDYPNENVEDAIARLVRSQTDLIQRSAEDRDIVAVIRTRAFVDDVERMGAEVIYEPAGADLLIVYMLDLPDAMSPIGVEDLAGKSVEAVREIALENVRNWLPKVVADDERGGDVLYYVEGNTMLSTSLILLDEFWTSIKTRFPGDVLFALPRKDQLFVFDDDGDERTIALAHRLIDASFEGNFIPLSPLVYARRGGKISAVAD